MCRIVACAEWIFRNLRSSAYLALGSALAVLHRDGTSRSQS